jgi:DNA-binding response OmpR family regulator
MKERILIIEDDEGIVKILKRSLIYEGYQVDSAADGESGLNQAHILTW